MLGLEFSEQGIYLACSRIGFVPRHLIWFPWFLPRVSLNYWARTKPCAWQGINQTTPLLTTPQEKTERKGGNGWHIMFMYFAIYSIIVLYLQYCYILPTIYTKYKGYVIIFPSSSMLQYLQIIALWHYLCYCQVWSKRLLYFYAQQNESDILSCLFFSKSFDLSSFPLIPSNCSKLQGKFLFFSHR